jgi:hypothetical protein
MSNMASNGGKVAGKRKASDDEMTEDDGIVYIEFSIRGQVCTTFFFSIIASIFPVLFSS